MTRQKKRTERWEWGGYLGVLVLIVDRVSRFAVTYPFMTFRPISMRQVRHSDQILELLRGRPVIFIAFSAISTSFFGLNSFFAMASAVPQIARKNCRSKSRIEGRFPLLRWEA